MNMTTLESETLRDALSTIDALSDATLRSNYDLVSKLVERVRRCKNTPKPTASTNLEKLQTRLNASRTKILEPFFQQDHITAVGKQVDLQQDIRVNDILLATSPSAGHQSQYKFRKGLAKRSLALQYDKWQPQQSYGEARVQDLAEDCSRASAKEHGRIRQFLSFHGLSYENSVVDGVKQGTQLLVFERKIGITGSSALLVFCMGYFSKIKYSDFDRLISHFRRTSWLLTTANNMSSWFDECASVYESQCEGMPLKQPATAEVIEQRCLNSQRVENDCWPEQSREPGTSEASELHGGEGLSSDGQRNLPECSRSNLAERYETCLARTADSADIFTQWSLPRPSLQLSTPRIVSDTAESIRLTMSGDIVGLQSLFSRGLASPMDTSCTRGYSLIRWALYSGLCNYPTVTFLINQGARVDEESYQHVWDFSLRRRCTTDALHELKRITLNPPSSHTRDWIEEQEFPLIHRIVLGRSSSTLQSELDRNPGAVHSTDANRRTALDWATSIGDLSAMENLIHCGSPLNTADKSGRTTVLHAVDSHNEDALRIILQAGADPNHQVPNLRRSSPLKAACFGGLVGMVKLLLDFGADVDACNPEGWTAFQTVASTQTVECAKLLLDHGADRYKISDNGHSPLTSAISYNNHEMLRFLIAQSNNNGLLKGPRLIPVIAESGDVETLKIIASSTLAQNELLVHVNDFSSGLEILRSRWDYDERLQVAFDQLLSQSCRLGSRTVDDTL